MSLATDVGHTGEESPKRAGICSHEATPLFGPPARPCTRPHGHMATWPFLPSESRRIVLPAWYEPSLLQILGRLALRHLHSSVPVGTKRTPSPARRFHLICAAHEVKLLPVRLRQPRLTCVRRMRRGHRETSEVGHRDAAAAAAQWSRCSAIRSSRQLCRHGPSASAIRSPKLSKVRDSDLL